MSDDKCPGCEYVNQLVRWSKQPLDGAPPGAAGPCPAPREHVKPCPLAMHTCTACGSPADVRCVECGDWRCDKHWCGGQWCASYDVLHLAARACAQGEECSNSAERVKQAREWLTGESGDLIEAFPRSDELRETCLRGLAELEPVVVAARKASKALYTKTMARIAELEAALETSRQTKLEIGCDAASLREIAARYKQANERYKAKLEAVRALADNYRTMTALSPEESRLNFNFAAAIVRVLDGG